MADESATPPAEVKSRAPKKRDPEDLEGLIDMESLDDSMHYRFVHERPQRVARLRHKGYRVVRVGEDEGADTVRALVEDIVSPDGTIRDGDTILMCVPKERHQAGRNKLAALNKARMVAPKQQFRKKTRGTGPGGEDVRVVTTDKTDKG